MMCVSPSHYTVSNAQVGVTYIWTVNGGTPATSTGSTLDVNWSNTGSGSITVTTSGPDGCGPVTTTIPVAACSCPACKQFQTVVTLPTPPVAGVGGLENVAPSITSTMTGVTSIIETLLSTSVNYSPASCGVSGPLGACIRQASQSIPAASNPPVLPVPNGNQVIWQDTSAINFNTGVSSPFQFQLPPPPVLNPTCGASFSFCMSFSLANKECVNCTVIKCFGPFPYSQQGINPNGNPTAVENLAAQTKDQPKPSKKKKLLKGLEKAAGSIEVGGSKGKGNAKGVPKDQGVPK